MERKGKEWMEGKGWEGSEGNPPPRKNPSYWPVNTLVCTLYRHAGDSELLAFRRPFNVDQLYFRFRFVPRDRKR